MLGAVRQRLVETGEENTIIVFTSDNGMQWGDHGLDGKTTLHPRVHAEALRMLFLHVRLDRLARSRW
jgi:arylsulfatase A-like enzyme